MCHYNMIFCQWLWHLILLCQFKKIIQLFVFIFVTQPVCNTMLGKQYGLPHNIGQRDVHPIIVKWSVLKCLVVITFACTDLFSVFTVHL